MILSGRDVRLYIEAGKLKIDPVSDEQFQQNGVDLILEEVRHMNWNTPSQPLLFFWGVRARPCHSLMT